MRKRISKLDDQKVLGIVRIPWLPQNIVQRINAHRSFILYLVIGGGAVVIDVGVFWLLDAFTNLNVIICNSCSVFAAMIYSFFLNAHFNFRTTDGLLLRFVGFAIVTAIGFIVSSLALWLEVEVLGLPAVLSKCLTLPLVLIVQFLLNSRFTFKNSSKDVEDITLESVL